MKKADMLANKLKEAEIQEKLWNIQAKVVELEAKKAEIEEKKRKDEIELNKTSIQKIEVLRYLLCSVTVDEDSITGGFDQKLKPVLDESQKQSVIDKMFSLMYKL